MSDRELMQQAMEDLRMVAPDTCVETIEALRARLAEPDDEPVGLAMSAGNSYPGLTIVVLDESAVPVGTKLYTRPAARKVQPLTDEQIDALFPMPAKDLMMRTMERNIARAVERAHGITGDSHE